MALVNLFFDKNSRAYITTDCGPLYPMPGETTKVGDCDVFLQYTKTEVVVKLDGAPATVSRREDRRGRVYLRCTTHDQARIPPVPAALMRLITK